MEYATRVLATLPLAFLAAWAVARVSGVDGSVALVLASIPVAVGIGYVLFVDAPDPP